MNERKSLKSLKNKLSETRQLNFWFHLQQRYILMRCKDFIFLETKTKLYCKEFFFRKLKNLRIFGKDNILKEILL